MTKKQKKMLQRILIAAALLVILHFVPATGLLKLALYLVPYLIIGYDVLKKAVRGILNGQVFDENFLMAVATVGAVALGDYNEGAAVMLFYQVGHPPRLRQPEKGRQGRAGGPGRSGRGR